MKATILLATVLFLISAPAPDSGDIAELTSNFIETDNTPGLMAAENPAGSSEDIDSLNVVNPGGQDSENMSSSAQVSNPPEQNHRDS
jgi:hypothetical protein